MSVMKVDCTDNNFEGKTLLLTGANGGIGRATAEFFFMRGANVVLADILLDPLLSFCELLTDTHHRLLSLRYDASSWDDAKSIVDQTVNRFGAIDFLVPAAAIYKEECLASMTEAQWRRTMSVNLDGVFYLCRHAISMMRQGSSIVTLSSDAAHQGSTLNHFHYSASKGGVLSLTRSLAKELAPKIRVNAVSPGVIDTPMIADVMSKRGLEILAATPMGRMGRPGEIASVIAFLCSDAASFITGETIQINGGGYLG